MYYQGFWRPNGGKKDSLFAKLVHPDKIGTTRAISKNPHNFVVAGLSVVSNGGADGGRRLRASFILPSLASARAGNYLRPPVGHPHLRLCSYPLRLGYFIILKAQLLPSAPLAAT